MEQNIKLNPNIKPNTPKINTIDVLANAKPIRLNPTHNSPQSTSSGVRLNDQNENIASIKTPQNMPNLQNPNQLKPQATQNINIANPPLNQANQMKQAAPQAPKQAMPSPTPTTAQVKATPQNIAQISPTKPQQNIQAQAPKAQPQPISINTAPTQPKKPESSPSKDENIDDGVGQVQGIHTEQVEETIIDNTFHNPNLESLKVNVTQLDFAVTRKVRGYLKKLLGVNGSDLHLKAGAKIRARIHGDIVVFSDEVFTKDEAITLAKELTRTRYPEFVQNKEMDMTYIYDSQNRFRVNMFFQMDGVSFAFRTIPTIQNTIDELGLPKAIHNIVDMERGLVLVTGVTGSGKSTTLASIINAINNKHAKHIITIEDPIEFIHKDIKSIINQRSVGMDTNSFAGALKAALREDPDIILVGEMRDIETTEMALHAAETGHLVLSTLHTLDAKETINRIISIFPTTDQGRIRAVLASTLNAVISQRLLKSKDGKRTAAIELLFRTPRIEIIIAEGRDGEIIEALAEGKDIYQTQTFDQHLFELITNGVVEEEIALEKATSPSDLKLRLQNINYSEREHPGDSITLKS